MTIRPIAYFCAEFAFDTNISAYAGGLGVLAGDYLKEASDQNLPVVAVGLMYGNTDLPVLLEIDVPIQDQNIKVQVYKHMVGSVPVYLLGHNNITQRLYTSDKETRLKQEIILGIGGLRALVALDIHPLVYHLNEGHSAFLALELIKHEMAVHKFSFADALLIIKKRIVFTNHTLVAAGQEIYSNDLVSMMLAGYAREIGVSVNEIVKMGLIQESSVFSMTMLSLRMSGNINAVSILHAKKAAEIWTDHTMIPITNGIHIKSWDQVGKDLVKNHFQQKQKLIKDFGWDPETLVIGWARRFVEYKRPLAILENLEQLKKLPVKIIFSGEPHENDIRGKELLNELLTMLNANITYIPHYNTEVAKRMVSGCDIWLNTPIVGFEACGTSGMKAALNGTLPFTTRDGWVDEVELYKIGWILENDNLNSNLLDILEHEIVPMYYKNPTLWQEHMQNARDLIINQFSTTRMLGEYEERFYKPLRVGRS
ncbi:glycogen/starch/alpha-glucan phosphorylase [Candidatus Amesbacteria bacterium]|nr:glycogen/starch/alpha-glucan phosphorylase [Candidatus Amesbacteria bacterium]